MANVLVTGTNRGIGLELCRQLAARGDTVIAACRKPSAALTALAADAPGGSLRVEAGVDVSDRASLDALADRLGDLALDLLIANAGLLEGTSLQNWDRTAITRQFAVNALGTLDTVHALLPALAEGSKVAVVTSRMGSIEDNDSGGSYGYRMSKAALNAGAKSLSIDLKPRGIAVAILHPGFVKTDMTGKRGMIDADASAEGLIERIDELALDSSGTFWHQNGEVLPW